MTNMTYCISAHKDSDICKTCVRDIHKYKNAGIVSLSQFTPVYSKIQGWYCEYEVKGEVNDDECTKSVN